MQIYALAALSISEVLRTTPGVRERFWDMFVVDAFLKNPDRNNGNWGLLCSPEGTWSLAPVYALGSSLFSKRSDSLAAERAKDDQSLEACASVCQAPVPRHAREDAFGTNVSCYRVVGDDGKPHAIHPFDYLRESRDPEAVDEGSYRKYSAEGTLQMKMQAPDMSKVAGGSSFKSFKAAGEGTGGPRGNAASAAFTFSDDKGKIQATSLKFVTDVTMRIFSTYTNTQEVNAASTLYKD